jgi:hypothetical protein
LPFWYLCFLLQSKASLALYWKRKQKYQNGNIHRKLKVPTSEREGKLSNPRGHAARARCMIFPPENLRNPAQTNATRAPCGDFLPPIGTVPTGRRASKPPRILWFVHTFGCASSLTMRTSLVL